MSTSSKLQGILGIADSKQKVAEYNNLATDLAKKNAKSDLVEVVRTSMCKKNTKFNTRF